MASLSRNPTSILLRASSRTLTFSSDSTSIKTTNISRLNGILRLPPAIRVRSFHATASRPIYTQTVDTTHYLLTSLHSISYTPWVLTLPLFALLLRGAIFLPIALKQRRATKQQVELTPLLNAWKHTFTAHAKQDVGHLGPGHVEREALRMLRMKRKEMYKRHNCSLWKSFLGLAQLPVFLGVMETLRLMVGVPGGLFGLFKNPWSAKAQVSNESDAVITGDGMTSSLDIPVEAGMATEGILWFPNLLVADPQLILPFVLSGTILLNIFGHRPSSLPLTKWQARIRRGMGTTALLVGPAMMAFPSALLVYWISNSVLNWAQHWLLAWWIPIEPPSKPLIPKRPWRTGLGRKEHGGMT